MPYNIQTGQLDLGGLKEYFLRPEPTSLSGSSSNTTGFYPYTGNPSDFSTYTQLTGISGDISGYIDSVSGVLRADLVESGTNLSGYTKSVRGELKSDITSISGNVDDVETDLELLTVVVNQNEDDISTLNTDLVVSGEKLSVLITGNLGDGLSGYVTGHVEETSGILNTKISNLDLSLRSHVSSDYVTKEDVDENIDGQKTFLKDSHFKQGIHFSKVSSHENISTIQDGVGLYSVVTNDTYGDPEETYQILTNYMRFPSRGATQPDESVIISSLQYTGDIPE